MRRMFSEKQIGDIALKQLADKDLKVKTIEQSEANWSLDISEIPMIGLPEGISYETIYGRLEQIGNILYMVLAFTFENTTEENINMSNPYLEITLDEEIASKIYDFSGHTAKESSNSPISADIAFRGDNSSPSALNRSVGYYIISNIGTANKIRLNLYGWSTINAGVKQVACFRTFLTLL